MHKNLFWMAFLVVIAFIVLYYTGVAAYRYYTYSTLTAKTIAQNVQWSVQEIASDEYVLEADYNFELNQKKYQNRYLFKDSIYRNEYAAHYDIPHFVNRSWVVWYNPRNPEQSTLQKNFPYKESISAIFLWGLLFYFIWLGFYVGRYKT